MRRIVIATSNAGKLAEFRRYFEGVTKVEVCSLSELGLKLDVEETGATFFENAWLKAHACATQTGEWSLADDSGLEVDALGGQPGVYSARYGGIGASDTQNTAKLLAALAGVPPERRTARFRCALVVAASGQSEPLCRADGVCEGSIAESPAGTRGFGYDPVFIPSGYAQTFGELGAAAKDALSHRSRAAAALIEGLRPCLAEMR